MPGLQAVEGRRYIPGLPGGGQGLQEQGVRQHGVLGLLEADQQLLFDLVGVQLRGEEVLALDARGGRSTPAIWDGQKLVEGRVAVLAFLDAMPA